MKTTITFGRMNPPTRGHERLIDKVKELAGDGDHHVFTSQTHDPKRNPLNPEQKHGYLRSSFPDTNIVSQPSPFHALKQLQDDGYRDVTVVVGADRTKEFERIGSHKDFNFDNYNVVSAGEREGGEIESISASGARAAARDKKYGKFKQMTPTLMSRGQARQMFSDLQSQMEEFNLTEELFSDEEEMELFMEAFLPMKYLFEQDTYAAQNMAMDTMKGGADFGQDTKDRDRKRLDRQESRKKTESNPWPELLVVRNAQDNKIRIIPKADFDSSFQEILVGNMPGSPPMGEMTPQVAFSVMQEADFEASKTSNKLLKMFGVSDPRELSIGSQPAPGGGGGPTPIGGGMITPEEEMAMNAPRTPPKGIEKLDPLSTYPDWDHQPADLIDSGIMAWNVATGRNPLDGGVPPEIEQAMAISMTLGDSANRFASGLMQEIPPDYVAYTNIGIPAQPTPQWTHFGGTDPTPKADMIFMNPATNDYIRANVGAGKQQIMSSAKGESTALFNTLAVSGNGLTFTQRKEAKALTDNIKTKLAQILSGLEEKTRTIKEDVNDVIAEATRIYDEISGKIEDMMSVDRNLKKEILREVITGQLKFGPDSIAAASHVIATNRDGTNTQIQLITDGYLSRLNSVANINIIFAPADIETRLETQKTDGNTFLDYIRALVQNTEDSLNLDKMSMGVDFEPVADFNIDGNPFQTDLFTDVNPQQGPEQVDSIEMKQNLRNMSQRAIENFNNIFDVMQFFSIGVDAIDIDPINLTILNEKRAEKYNIITINGKRFRVPVEEEIEDIIDDYNYIDSAFKEFVLEGRTERILKKPENGAAGCAPGPRRSEWCNNRKRHGYRRDLQNYRRKNNLVGKTKEHGSHSGKGAAKDPKSKIVGLRDPNENMSDNKKEKIKEDHGGGFIGTPELLLRYLKDTPYSGIIGYLPKSSKVKTKSKEYNGKKRKRKRK